MFSQYAQRPFNGANLNDFIKNPEQRCPVLVVADTSASMSGTGIDQVNKGIQVLLQGIAADPLTLKRVELAIITFGQTVSVVQDFATVDMIQVPVFTASGSTPLGQAITKGLDLIEARKRVYRAAGQSALKPNVILLTDGCPTDDWKAAATRLGTYHNSDRLFLLSVGVDGADMAMLNGICNRPAEHIEADQIAALMMFVSDSLCAISSSRPSDNATFGELEL